MGSGMVVTMVSSLRIKTRFVVVRCESKNLPEMDNDSLQLCNSCFQAAGIRSSKKGNSFVQGTIQLLCTFTGYTIPINYSIFFELITDTNFIMFSISKCFKLASRIKYSP